MELYFLRHGEAEPTSLAGSDAGRALTDQGRRDVTAMAELAQRAGILPEANFSSA